MRHYHYYNKSTGEIHPKSVATSHHDAKIAEAFAISATPAEHAHIEGRFNPHHHRVDPVTKAIIHHAKPKEYTMVHITDQGVVQSGPTVTGS